MANGYTLNIQNPKDSPMEIVNKINTLDNVINIKTIRDGVSRTELVNELNSMSANLSTKLEDQGKKTFNHIEATYTRIGGQKKMTDQRYHGAGGSSDKTKVTGILKGNGAEISAAVSGTDLKTINGNSIIGSGNIATGIAIGDTITSATLGSVLFAGTAGVLDQDNANLFWDKTNKRLVFGPAKIAIGSLSGYAGLWLGSNTTTPSFTNYAILEDVSSETIINSPSKVYLRISNADIGILTSTGLAALTLKATQAAGFISSDGSTGYTGTVTTATLVGKTLTIKDGIITGFA